MKGISKSIKILPFLAMLFLLSFSPAYGAAMGDYCIIPPYVVTDLKPNVLLYMDNSASMYDLEYIDEGTTTREPAYCYDETYKSTKKYYGYFDQNTNYEYDLINNNFKVTASGLAGCTKVIPNTLCIGLNMATVPPTLTDFRAKGNYLNWLVTSKFDAQKGVLTGGKYCDKVCSNSNITCCTQIADCPAGVGVTCDNVDNFLQAESRGCVGRKFIKEAITADFIDYTPPAADPNTSLGITFGVRGPMNDLNSTAASTGGQTYIDLFVGNYLQGECQAAIDAFEEGHDPASIKKAVDDCLSATVSPAAYCQNEPLYPPPLGGCTKDSNCIKAAGKCEGNPKKCTLGNPALIGTACQKNADCDWNVGPCVTGTATTVSKQKVVFNQTIQACWALTQGTPISIDEANTVKNQCTDLYDENFICIGGANDGKVCAFAADCPGGLCISGPTAIRPGNPSYLCSTAYTGACYTGSAPAWASSWVSDACIIAAHTAFCGALDIPPVIDPTDDPSVTQEFINLPAIISDIGVEAQLGQPIKSLAVEVRYDSVCAVASATSCVTDADCPTGDYCKPYGILQEFDGQVRFGMMAFNYNGSATECDNLTSFKCPRICEKTTSLMCNTTVGAPSIDCPVDPSTGARELCIATIKDNTNKDAAQIRVYMKSVCSVSGTICNLDSECPDGEVCRPKVGNHTTGLISEIDKMRATTWTPYAEAFFDGIAYFTQKTASGAVPYRLYTTDFRVPSDVPSEPNPIQGICQDNNIVFISDGMSTTDQNAAVMNFVASNNAGGEITTAPSATWDVVPRFFGSKNLDDLAYYGQHAALSNPVSATKNIRPIMTSVLYSGSECDVKAADGITCTTTDEAVPEKLMQLTAYHGGGVYRLIHNPDDFRTALYDILQSLLKRASAGAAASVLASGEGSGANIVQAVFYPKRKFSLNTSAGTSISSEIRWTGRLGNFWYYVDPFFKSSSIYEDNASPKVLNLTNDNKITFYYDPDLEQTMAERAYDTGGDGVPDTALAPIPFERLNTLWEAGIALFKRDLGVTPRQIYTTTNGTSLLAGDFSIGNAATLCSFLSPPDYDGDASVACDADDATTLIRYIHGEDFSGLRSRTVPIDLNGNGTLDAGEQRVWKLGDILNSTPRIASWLPQNTYHEVYKDISYLNFINSAGYKSKNMVYAGGNDGMLHAFRLGTLELGWAGQSEFEKARILPLAGTDFGKEIWAFIPKNVLPYLKYIPELTYCHLYTVDLSPIVFDASIGGVSTAVRPNDGSTWRTVLIGGMQYGGGCKDPADANSDGIADSCNPTDDMNGDGSIDNDDCVLTPVSGNGYSSYFALDITNENSPVLLWEFTNSGLGFSTTGPAIVRVGEQDKNGKWVVVFGSGPTGPIEKTTHQFMGNSDQNMKLFLVDLETGSLINTIDTGIANAFAGSLEDVTFDSNVDYQDDILYVGYTKKSVSGEWNDGGVLRLLTHEADPTTTNWDVSVVLDGIGPVTTSVTRLQNNKTHELWLFFGTGRYYFEIDDRVDDGDTVRRLYGVKDPCFTDANIINPTSCAPVTGTLTDVTLAANANLLPEDIGAGGWYLDLDDSDSYTYNERGTLVARNYRAERVISNPLAASTGIVFYSTFKPYNEICSYGGKSFTWAMRYNTGGAPGTLLRGIALVQVSTGSIEQMSLSDAFKQDALKNPDSKGDRRGPAIEGKVGGSIRLMSTPPPVKRVLHIRER